MIVRILGEGQLQVPDDEAGALDLLDEELLRAVESGDEERFRQALAALLDKARRSGTPLPDDSIVPSELVLPSADAGLAEVRDLLGDDGLIPG
jgi:hypothetical protein